MSKVKSSLLSINRHRQLVPAWLTGAWGVLGILSVVYLIVFLAWTAFHWGDPEHVALIGNLTVLPLGMLATLTAWRVAARRQLAPRLRRAWFLLGLGFLANFVGDLIWAYLQTVLHVDLFPSLADPFYLAFYPLMLAGL